MARVAEPTEDGHFVVIDGRRWRATDPAIPDALRTQLQSELMAARRAVKAAKADGDAAQERLARDRVQDAKVALGERGAPWWETVDDDVRAVRLASTMRALLRARDPEKTICPSDAARAACSPTWRPHLQAARAVAFELQADGVVEVRHAGERVEHLADVHGVLRIARGPRL